MTKNEQLINYIAKKAVTCEDNCRIDYELYDAFGVKKGLRDENGKGVLVGLTNISHIHSFVEENGERVPCEGKLWYRGYDIIDLVRGFRQEGRYGFEETTYLLLFGDLPNEKELSDFKKVLAGLCSLPKSFTRDVIMKAPTKDIMNNLSRSVLTLASYDEDAADLRIENVLRQCMMLISVFPMLVVYGYHAYNHYLKDESLYIHRPDPELSAAENILRMLRPDKQYTELEAHVLDVALVLHMEHGGGNNSSFTTHVITSAGSDTYSVVAAALSSLKGPKHGGANIKVIEMMDDLKANVTDITDREQVRDYLQRLVDKKAFDGKGLIYGMGHAIYSISDPRAKVFKGYVEQLAKEKHLEDDFNLYTMVEEMAPEIISSKRKTVKDVSANVDFFSGFVYRMLDIPEELYTPIFAMARIVGWSAHRLEELVNANKIIRPAYDSIGEERKYRTMDER